MKALVIGGNRFFGKKLVHLLLNKEVDVTVLNRGQSKDDFGNNVQRIVIDRKLLTKDHPDLKNQYWDLIYDQVCFDAVDARQACEIFHGQVGHYIFTSSQSVYDPGTAITEDIFDPESYKFTDIANKDKAYAEAKRQAEAVFAQVARFPLTIVRFPIVIGNDDYTGRLKFHLDHVVEGKAMYFPNLNAKMSFISSDDAAKALEFIGSHKLIGPLNCCSAEPLTLNEFIKTLEAITHKSAIFADSEKSGDHSPYGIQSDWYMNIDKLQQAGFTPAPIKEQIKQALI